MQYQRLQYGDELASTILFAGGDLKARVFASSDHVFPVWQCAGRLGELVAQAAVKASNRHQQLRLRPSPAACSRGLLRSVWLAQVPVGRTYSLRIRGQTVLGNCRARLVRDRIAD